MQLQIAAATCRIETKSKSADYQMTLVLVTFEKEVSYRQSLSALFVCSSDCRLDEQYRRHRSRLLYSVYTMKQT